MDTIREEFPGLIIGYFNRTRETFLHKPHWDPD
jgi:hypothetical protein